MDTSVETVVRAKAALSAAEAALKAEQRDREKRELNATRAALRRKRADFERTSQAVRVADTRLAQAREAAARRYLDVTTHLTLRPACADVLPDDPEVQEWQSRHRRLTTSLAEATKLRNAEQTSLPDRMVAVKLADEIQRLEYAEQNLLRKLRGELPAVWQGGLGAVR